MAVTALIPFALMPWLGILEASEIAGNYITVKLFKSFKNIVKLHLQKHVFIYKYFKFGCPL